MNQRRGKKKNNKSKKEIAKLLAKSERTIRREIKRGLTTIKDSQWRDVSIYSADVSQAKYEYNKTGKGGELILDREAELVKHIEERILKHKERVMQGQKDYAEILGRRIIRVDRAMEGLEPLYRKLVEERYFERNEMKDCIRNIDGMSKNQ